MRRLLTATFVAVVATSGLIPPAAAQATVPLVTSPAPAAMAASVSLAGQAGTVVRLRLRAAITSLPVARERTVGYDRDKFGGWRDADNDCRDTRAEVLRAESRRAVTGRCTVLRGLWQSYYDRRSWRAASDVDIDHMVPLSEAWKSGARRWNANTRHRYANDLGDPRALVAVTDNVNQSKGDNDPSNWLPQYGRCSYVRQYTAVKLRWSLKADRAEKRALLRVASHCRNDVLRVRKARVGTGTSQPPSGGGGGRDPRFEYCYQAIEHGYGPYYRGRDPEYPWYTDADNDGVVCE